jgi:uncharacterized protein
MGRSQYIIKFGGLPVGVHDFEFEVKDAFFKSIENSEVQAADLEVRARLTKQNNVLQVHFVINGVIGIDCDRCLKSFGYPVVTEEILVVKHGQPEESTDEILVIPEGVEEFDVAQYLYEYIVLALPARRVPCELDEAQFPCDYDMLAKLEELAAPEEKEKTEEDEPNNPIWEKLNKIKYNKN